MVLTAFLLGNQHKKGIVWRTSRQACLLCPWARRLTGRLHVYVANRWRTRTPPGYNCEVAHPLCHKRRILDTHQWQSALLVVGLQVIHKMDCHLSPSLISIRLAAWTWIIVRTIPPSRGRRGAITTTTIIFSFAPKGLIRKTNLIVKIWKMMQYSAWTIIFLFVTFTHLWKCRYNPAYRPLNSLNRKLP